MSDQNRSTLIAVVALLLVYGEGAYLAATPLLGDSRPLAPAADSICALPGSITGSIGVIMQFPDAGVEGRPTGRDRARESSGGALYSGERTVRLGVVDGTATPSEPVDRAGRMAGLASEMASPGLLHLWR